jgi:hypothetical protein
VIGTIELNEGLGVIWLRNIWESEMKCRYLALVALASLTTSILPASAVVLHEPNKKIFATEGYSDFWFSTKAFGKKSDLGTNSLTNIEAVMETETWIGQGLTSTGGGACGAGGVSCAKKTASYSGEEANVFVVVFDKNKKVLTFLFDEAVSQFDISKLSKVTAIYAFLLDQPPALPVLDQVVETAPTYQNPLPAAVWLLGPGVAGVFYLSRRRRQRKAGAVPA